MNRAMARCTRARSRRGNPIGVPGRRRAGTRSRADGERLSKPTRPSLARSSDSSGGPKSWRNFDTTENSSVGPHRRRPRRIMANRIREPVFSGHGYSPAITRVLIDVPQVGAGAVRRGALPGGEPARPESAAVSAEAQVIRLVASPPPGGPAAAGGPQMTERTTGPITEGGAPASPPLVLHVIPTTTARGAQVEARAVADELDAPGVRIHRVLSLFDGRPEVASDYSLGH